MKKFVIGDIHGNFNALKEVLKKSKFNYKKDKLIVLGDIVDGNKDTFKVVEELLKIKNLVFILGNHDEWFLKFMNDGFDEEIWIQQGGANTLRSYGAKVIESEHVCNKSYINTKNLSIPITHQEFFNNHVLYHIEDNMLFVHGGINPKIPNIKSQSKFDLLWDRNLINYCIKGKFVPRYKKIFIGHTTTQQFDCTKPLRFGQLWMMDTGIGYDGKLTIMDIKTEEFWSSQKNYPSYSK